MEEDLLSDENLANFVGCEDDESKQERKEEKLDWYRPENGVTNENGCLRFKDYKMAEAYLVLNMLLMNGK